MARRGIIREFVRDLVEDGDGEDETIGQELAGRLRSNRDERNPASSPKASATAPAPAAPSEEPASEPRGPRFLDPFAEAEAEAEAAEEAAATLTAAPKPVTPDARREEFGKALDSDLDKDGIPDRFDQDIDDDTKLNRDDEDLDDDGVRNEDDDDNDDDGFSDRSESDALQEAIRKDGDLDLDGKQNQRDEDADGDGRSNLEERRDVLDALERKITDGKTVEELSRIASDEDGFNDAVSGAVSGAFQIDRDGDGVVDPLDEEPDTAVKATTTKPAERPAVEVPAKPAKPKAKSPTIEELAEEEPPLTVVHLGVDAKLRRDDGSVIDPDDEDDEFDVDPNEGRLSIAEIVDDADKGAVLRDVDLRQPVGHVGFQLFDDEGNLVDENNQVIKPVDELLFDDAGNVVDEDGSVVAPQGSLSETAELDEGF